MSRPDPVPELEVAKEQGSLRSLGVAATGAGAALVTTAATACCVPVIAPLVVSVLGVSGAVWAAGLKPYSPYMLAASALLLGYGFWTVYRPRPASAGATCPVRRPRLPQIILWVAGALWLVALALNVLPVLVRFLLTLENS